jgi:branched-chain amino acid transport system ATP-binding protein
MLELRNITAGYDNHTVLRDVTVVVPDHSVVSLLGPNGAGKTTLLRVASGLLKPQSGSVILNGLDVTGWPPNKLARAGLGHVPEGRGIFAGMTVWENLRMEAPADREGAALGLVGDVFPRLKDRTKQVAGSLSGGEQQMLALASIYLAEPQVALLDEVSMGLAPNIVDEIYVHLRRIAARGASLLLVEQYVGRALAIAQYVYVMRKGQIEFVGEPTELGESDVLAAYLGESA